MTPAQLETVVARTRHERFRWLTSDDNPDVEQREGYRRVVERLATGEPPPPVSATPPPSLARDLSIYRVARRLGGRNCWYADNPSCGCSGQARCHALGRDVTIIHCAACLKDVS